MKIKKIGIGILGSFILLPSLSFAANTKAIREECFNQLKANISEAGIFEEAEKEFSHLDYKNLENKLSRNYKNLSSFGIDVDQPIFEQKVYSFGAQTGYMHPPFSPFPTYTKADKWEKPAKQNVFSEEYVRDEKGNLHFLSCGFIRIEAGDLMQVTSENYLYDGEIISVLKTDKDKKYKAWYNENTSYDHENKPFVSWQRLFIYPASSVNNYFNRFSIADAFPSNSSDSLDLFKPKKINIADMPSDLLKKVKEKTGKENPTEEDIMSVMGDGAPRVYVVDSAGKVKTSIARKELMPVDLGGADKVFGLNSFYQAIEDQFPVFAKHLALRGVVKFDTLKKVLASKDAPALAHIWSTVLDTREITKYALEKKQGKVAKKNEVDFYETYLPKLPQMESEITTALENVKTPKRKVRRSKNAGDNILVEPADDKSIGELTRNTMFYLWGGLGVLFLVVVIYLIGRKK